LIGEKRLGEDQPVAEVFLDILHAIATDPIVVHVVVIRRVEEAIVERAHGRLCGAGGLAVILRAIGIVAGLSADGGQFVVCLGVGLQGTRGGTAAGGGIAIVVIGPVVPYAGEEAVVVHADTGLIRAGKSFCVCQRRGRGRRVHAIHI